MPLPPKEKATEACVRSFRHALWSPFASGMQNLPEGRTGLVLTESGSSLVMALLWEIRYLRMGRGRPPVFLASRPVPWFPEAILTSVPETGADMERLGLDYLALPLSRDDLALLFLRDMFFRGRLRPRSFLCREAGVGCLYPLYRIAERDLVRFCARLGLPGVQKMPGMEETRAVVKKTGMDTEVLRERIFCAMENVREETFPDMGS